MFSRWLGWVWPFRPLQFWHLFKRTYLLLGQHHFTYSLWPPCCLRVRWKWPLSTGCPLPQIQPWLQNPHSWTAGLFQPLYHPGSSTSSVSLSLSCRNGATSLGPLEQNLLILLSFVHASWYQSGLPLLLLLSRIHLLFGLKRMKGQPLHWNRILGNHLICPLRNWWEAPNKDLWLYAEQIIRMARLLEIQLTSLAPQPKDKILGRLYLDALGTSTSPML